jgi:hypothetical protein
MIRGHGSCVNFCYLKGLPEQSAHAFRLRPRLLRLPPCWLCVMLRARVVESSEPRSC